MNAVVNSWSLAERFSWLRRLGRPRYAFRQIMKAYRLVILANSVVHLHGRDRLNYSKEELIVICVVRNGSKYVKSFIDYYFALGVKNIVFLDNGSTDDTVARAAGYDNVTVLKTELPYSRYENIMKEYLARRFSNGRWNLCVDIDEFFDWPFSRRLKLKFLLRYLNNRGFTAVVAQMLDLFSELPLSQLSDEQNELRKNYRYYDVSNISKTPYGYSRNENTDISMHWGGIRHSIFGTRNGLTKAPLVFVGSRIKLFRNWHHVENARLADFTCALLHYPFISTFYDKVRDAAATKRYGVVTSDEYDMYWAVISSNPNITLPQQTSREYAGTEQLLDEGFLVASPKFRDWVSQYGESRNSEAGSV